MAGKFSIYKYCKTDVGWRYCKAAFYPNGKIKPNIVIVSGVEEKHTEGRYFLNFNNRWIDVGLDALDAQRRGRNTGRVAFTPSRCRTVPASASSIPVTTPAASRSH